MNPTTLSDEEFTALLPWYLNGTLDETRRRQVEQRVRADAQAAQWLAQHRAVREAVRHGAADVPADLGWEEFARRHGLASPDAAPPEAAQGPRARRSPWAAAAAVVMLCQAIAIGVLWTRHPSAGEEPVVRSAAPAADGSVLIRVSFKPAATELAVRKLLLAVDGHIVDGPSQLGEYVVAIPAARAEEARKALAADAAVASVGVSP